MNHRVFTLLLGATAALATLTACGASNSDTGGSAGNPPAAASGAVSVKDVDGVGQALVDPAGKTLYFADQEAGGTIKCTANCLSFWMPVAGSTDAAKSMAGLGVIKRSDTGADQLTFQGKPLYTFKLDTAPGQDNGNNVQDAFSGTTFTWHAAATSAAAPTQAPSTSTGGGYGY
jgi:predicted lipoprotein with Yx(FWY)xxD motif